jgi:hypothetical protein
MAEFFRMAAGRMMMQMVGAFAKFERAMLRTALYTKLRVRDYADTIQPSSSTSVLSQESRASALLNRAQVPEAG